MWKSGEVIAKNYLLTANVVSSLIKQNTRS